ncbi:MAG TPA: AI-2E family transporter [Actinomycetota bacterium]|nr:AI-2E family transporter [Actinomycetota bacterium]
MDRPERPAAPAALHHAGAVGWRVLVLLVLTYLIARFLVRLQLVVVPVIVALFLTAVLLPPVDWLRDRGWPSAAATAAVLLAAVLGLAGAGYLLAVQVIPQLGQLSGQVSDSVDQLQDWLISGPIGLSQDQLLDLLERGQQELQERSDMLVQRALGWTTLLVELVAGALFAVVLAFFFLKDGRRMVDAAMARVGGPAGRRLRPAGRRAWDTMGGYLRGVAVVGVVDGALIGLALVLLGVPLALPLAVLTAVGAFLPIVGAVVAGALAALVALVSKGPVTALVVVGVTVLVQQLEGNLLQPVVMGRSLDLHPVAVMLALSVGGILGGIVGAVLAGPVVAVATAGIGGWADAGAEEPGPARSPPPPEGADGEPG